MFYNAVGLAYKVTIEICIHELQLRCYSERGFYRISVDNNDIKIQRFSLFSVFTTLSEQGKNG